MFSLKPSSFLEEEVPLHTSPSMPTADGTSGSSQEAINEKTGVTVLAAKPEYTTKSDDSDNNPNAIIVTGADAALHLLPLRDDFDRVLTFRSILLASGLACFQAVMNQIYQVIPVALCLAQPLTTP